MRSRSVVVRWRWFVVSICLSLAACGSVVSGEGDGDVAVDDGGRLDGPPDVAVDVDAGADGDADLGADVDAGADGDADFAPDDGPDVPDDIGPESEFTGREDGGATEGIACGPGEELCEGVCVDTRTDPANCGGCGGTCTSEQVCLDGSCVPILDDMICFRFGHGSPVTCTGPGQAYGVVCTTGTACASTTTWAACDVHPVCEMGVLDVPGTYGCTGCIDGIPRGSYHLTGFVDIDGNAVAASPEPDPGDLIAHGCVMYGVPRTEAEPYAAIDLSECVPEPY
ncbi:MAG: hypothetical protein JXB32_18370 [Deltaproteobacteria bacterium]|nr:hypothetical protein [Deltaproteobacteria bacterium]